MFGIANGLTISDPHNIYCNFFHFGLSYKSTIKNIEILIPTLYNIITEFLIDKQTLINEAESQKIILPNLRITDDSQKIKTLAKLYIPENNRHFSVTQLELDILKLRIQGYTNKEIAHLLDIKDKKLDYNLSKIKEKTGYTSSPQLGFMIRDLSLHNFWENK